MWGWALLGLAVLLSSGCSTTPRDQKAVIERAYPESTQVVQPVRTVTNFTDALACMDNLMLESGQTPILITSKNINDASGKAGTATKEMITTALSEMSRASGTFRFVDFEIDLARQDTVQNMSNMLLGMNALTISAPQYYVSGAVSYIDQNIISRRRGYGVGGDVSFADKAFGYDLGIDSDINASIVALDLHLGDMKTRTLLPGVHSANTAIVAKGGSGFDNGGTVGVGSGMNKKPSTSSSNGSSSSDEEQPAGRIVKFGVNFNLSHDYSQGTGVAVRTLVELGLVEMVGKWLKLPYWRCLALDQAHPEFQRELYEWYRKLEPEQLIKVFQLGLKQKGYYSGAVNGVEDKEFHSALVMFQTDKGNPPTGLINFAAYEQLVKDLVVVDNKTGVVQAEVLKLFNQGRGEDKIEVKPVTLQLDTVKGRTQYQPGEQLEFTLGVSRTSYARCYYQDADGAVVQIYPNPQQPKNLLSVRTRTFVPDLNNPDSFSVKFEKDGMERVMCLASQDDLLPYLPASLQGEPLQPIVGMDMDAIAKAAQSVSGRGPVAVSNLQLTIGTGQLAPEPAKSGKKTRR